MSEKVKTKKWRQGSEWEKRDESGRETTTRDRAARGTKRGLERERGKKASFPRAAVGGENVSDFSRLYTAKAGVGAPFFLHEKTFLRFPT